MKKLKFIANIFFLLSLIIMILVILQQLNIIHFLPTTVDPYKPSTHEAINKSDQYTILINSIGYIFLFVSIIMHILNLIITLKSKKTKNEISTSKNKNILLLIIKILLFICIIIFTLVVFGISLLITLLALMSFS